MELSIFELEKRIIFTDEYVSVLEIENQRLYVEIVSRFFQLFYGNEISQPFVIHDKSGINALKNDFVIVDNPFMLSYVSKAASAKLQKYILEKIQQTKEDKEITDLIEKLKIKFGEVFVDLELDLEYNDSISSADFLKILTPKLEFVDFYDISKTYKNLINILSRLKLYKFFIFVGVRRYLDNQQVVDLYKTAKVFGINLLILDNEIRELLPYENKLTVDKDLYEEIVC